MKLAVGCLIWGLAVTCAGSKPPPPVIETQEADLDPPSTPPASKGSEKETAEKGDVTGVDAGKKPSTATATPVVTLLEEGAEPRKELRHKFVNGGRQKLKMDAKTAIAGAGGAMPSLAMSGPIDTQIVEVKSGNAKFKLTAGPFKTSTSGGSAMAGAMGGLLGGGAAAQKISGWGIRSKSVV